MAFIWNNPNNLDNYLEILSSTFIEIQDNIDYIDDNIACDGHNSTIDNDKNTGYCNNRNSSVLNNKNTGYYSYN